jgi:hypothetical protein
MSKAKDVCAPVPVTHIEVSRLMEIEKKMEAADELCEWAKAYLTFPISQRRDALRKAIANYEGHNDKM